MSSDFRATPGLASTTDIRQRGPARPRPPADSIAQDLPTPQGAHTIQLSDDEYFRLRTPAQNRPVTRDIAQLAPRLGHCVALIDSVLGC
jgi:hypothetical protein